MCISDWSSDVCSSDLIQIVPTGDRAAVGAMLTGLNGAIDVIAPRSSHSKTTISAVTGMAAMAGQALSAGRSDRKSVVEGESVSVRVDHGGRRIIKKKKNIS